MYKTIIFNPELSFKNPITKETQKAKFINRHLNLFFHDDYLPKHKDPNKIHTPGTVEYIINTLKNDFGNTLFLKLEEAKEQAKEILYNDLSRITESHQNTLTICVVPRSKRLGRYLTAQLHFRQAVSEIADELSVINGVDYIKRHTDTLTTHLEQSGHGGEGKSPYPGITEDTCFISEKVKGAILTY